MARRVLAGSVMTAAAFGLTVGVYETCWTLLLTANGAALWQVGVSWTLFALPFVLMARPGGWLADHLDRRRLVVATVAISLACCGSYPFLHHLPLLIATAALEAMAIAVAIPAVQSLLSQAASPTQRGRAQGIFSTAQTATTALAAGVSGSLFAVLVLFLPAVWAPVTGRVPGASLAVRGDANQIASDLPASNRFLAD
jgi:DHA1 family multidrug resistance protein-like MFS transporter